MDITYIRFRPGWMYLFAALDWYSWFVVSWTVDLTLEIGFVLSTMQAALATATPSIGNSDQGSHFSSPLYTDLLHSANVQMSMDGKGRALDNIFTQRLHQALDYPTPETVYFAKGASSTDKHAVFVS